MIFNKRVFTFLLLLGFLVAEVKAQDIAANIPAFSDSVSLRPDSLIQPNILDKFQVDSGFSVYGKAVAGYITRHPTFHSAEKAVQMLELERVPPQTDWIFYLFTGLLFYLAVLKLLFPKYFSDLFSVFFNTALRQKQMREQLSQEPLPALLLNIFFVVSGGVFAYFVLVHYGFTRKYENTWLLLGFCILALIIIYVGKYLFLKFLGWIIGRSEQAETYIFVVYMVNKIIGMVLLPLGMLLAISEPGRVGTFLFFVWTGLVGLLLFRTVRGYQLLNKALKINFLHMIVFVISFEIIPILVLHKVLLNLFG